MLPARYRVPLLEALLRLSLPLPREIVTVDVPRCDNEGAGEFANGGGGAGGR